MQGEMSQEAAVELIISAILYDNFPLGACPRWLAKAPTSSLVWPVCPAPLAFPASKIGNGQSWQQAPILIMDTR